MDIDGAAAFLVRTLGYLYFLALVLRGVMRASAVDYYNPLSQAVLQLTSPAVRLFAALPTLGRVDLGVLCTALAAQLAVAAALAFIGGYPLFQPAYLGWALLGVCASVLDLYFFALIVLVIASWVAPYSRHPALALVAQITQPVCAPVRRLLPPLGGLDFSVMAVLLGIILLDSYLLVRPLATLLGANPYLMVGL